MAHEFACVLVRLALCSLCTLTLSYNILCRCLSCWAFLEPSNSYRRQSKMRKPTFPEQRSNATMIPRPPADSTQDPSLRIDRPRTTPRTDLKADLMSHNEVSSTSHDRDESPTTSVADLGRD